MSIQGLCFSEQVHFPFHRKIISLLHIPFVANIMYKFQAILPEKRPDFSRPTLLWRSGV